MKNKTREFCGSHTLEKLILQLEIQRDNMPRGFIQIQKKAGCAARIAKGLGFVEAWSVLSEICHVDRRYGQEVLRGMAIKRYNKALELLK